MPIYFKKLRTSSLEPETNVNGELVNDGVLFRIFNDGLVDNPMLQGYNPITWFQVFNDQMIDSANTDTGSVTLSSDGFSLYQG